LLRWPKAGVRKARRSIRPPPRVPGRVGRDRRRAARLWAGVELRLVARRPRPAGRRHCHNAELRAGTCDQPLSRELADARARRLWRAIRDRFRARTAVGWGTGGALGLERRVLLSRAPRADCPCPVLRASYGALASAQPGL